MNGDVNYVVMDSPYCPFLTCNEPMPHEHAICPCGALRYGNWFCPTCRTHRQITSNTQGKTDRGPAPTGTEADTNKETTR